MVDYGADSFILFALEGLSAILVTKPLVRPQTIALIMSSKMIQIKLMSPINAVGIHFGDSSLSKPEYNSSRPHCVCKLISVS